MEKINLKDFEEAYKKYIHTDKLVLAENKLDELLICYPNEDSYDHEYVTENNLLAQYTHHTRGCFVAFPHDFVVLYFTTDDKVPLALSEIRDKFVEKLKECMPDFDIHIDNNDIIINDKKISGASYNDYFAFFVSYNPDPEIIKHICKKQSEKIPGGLLEYGLSREEIEQILENIMIEFEERR